ncbi:MAG: InlB B-repeat-containing protein, partial [Fibrobacter sp.]|nr:InlB B-repeat-containing protein [Fibrobacter sp.]
MLKKCTFRFLFTLLAMAGMSAAATMTPVTPSKDGNCYQIGTAAELYGFAAIVNGTNGNTAEPAACGVLTADIVVNEHVLKNASGQSCVNTTNSPGSFNANGCSQPEYLNTLYTWTPIGTSSSKSFRGSFDGQGHTISGLFDNNTSSAAKYTGLFGYVSGTNATVSIKNVGVEDSYFRVTSYAGGIVGMVYNGSGELNIENVYSGSVLYIKGEGEVGGLVGYVKDWTLNITNAYNSGSIFGTSGTTKAIYVAGLVGCISSSARVNIKNAFNNGNLNGYAPLVNSNATVTNSFYLGNQSQGVYGVNKSSEDFSNGSVFAALRSAEGGSVWHQYQGDSYPSFAEKEGKTPFVPHSATLHYSSTESETIYFVEGLTASLPTVDKSENPVLGWYDNEGLTGTKYTEIPASANSDLTLYPKVMKLVGGCYEISDADMLYAFAAAVNNGNATACGKLTANIVVNQNVLTTADGTSNVSSSGEYIGSNSASFRQWTPIGYNYRPFKGTFDGQGHTISGLYFNDPSSSDVGLFSSVFGDPKPVTIENVGLVDSYFRGNSTVGGLVGNAKGLVTIKNSFNAGSINAQGEIFGGLVGYSWQSSADVVKLTISNSYNTGSLNGGSYGGGLVGSAVDLIISNSYNTGSVTVSKTNLENDDVNCVGGFAASADKVTITNSYNYGSVSSPDGARKDDFVTSFNNGSTVTNSFFISECDFEGNGATKMSSTQFSDGTVFAALRSAEDGEVWRQYSGDVYPTFVEKNGTDAPSPMHVAVLHYSATDSVAIAYTEGTALTLPTTLPDGSIVVGDWYKSNSLSGDTYTQIAATENGDLAFYAKAMKLDGDGYYEIADADMLFKFAELVNTQNSTYGSAKVKLTADIVVNEHVLADANGV